MSRCPECSPQRHIEETLRLSQASKYGQPSHAGFRQMKQRTLSSTGSERALPMVLTADSISVSELSMKPLSLSYFTPSFINAEKTAVPILGSLNQPPIVIFIPLSPPAPLC